MAEINTESQFDEVRPLLRPSVFTCFALFALSFTAAGCAQQTGWPMADYLSSPPPLAAEETRNLPSLVVTNDPPPDVIYRRGSRDTILATGTTAGALQLPGIDTQNIETLVTRKVADLSRDLNKLGHDTDSHQDRLKSLQSKSDADAAEYYALVASINTELQAGTTPGNPVLIERWNAAQEKLESLSESAGYLNELATDLANHASKASFTLENTRAAFGLSGAVKEDHKKLTIVEDGVNENIVRINRLLTQTNDEITRRTTYLRTERANMQSLSLGINNGELYGQSLSNSLFKKATEDGQAMFKPAPGTNSSAPSARRPLVIIRFDRADVNFDQPLYAAVSQALEKYPAARFDLVAVSPTEGNPAELALASTEARKQGEKVLRSLTQMGLPMERVRLNAASSSQALNSEVHLYIQ